MNEVPSPQLRISDLDREAALQALGEHMSIGRIDLEEYGDRSARVTAARTRGELTEIFTDLPEPHPRVGETPVQPAAAATAVQPAAEQRQPMAWTDRPLNQRLAAAAVPLVWIAGIVLFCTVGGWLWFLLPVAFTAIGRALWGHDWDPDQRRQRDRRHELRDSHRELRAERRDRRRDIDR